MNDARLKQLDRLATLLRDRDLARLGKLTRTRQELAGKIDALTQRVQISDDPALNAARLAHAKWAEQQRMLLNHALARQTAQTVNQKAQTARSVGRAMALARLRTKSR